MGHVTPVYTAFSKGEVSPLILGRFDLEQYVASLQKCRNCWIRPQGSVSRTVGTEFVAKAKYNDKKARFLKFVFSCTDAFIIEVGPGYFRFFNDGAPVVKTLSDTTAWITSTSYQRGDFVKNNNTIYYCEIAHTSGTFTNDLSNGNWVAQDVYEVPNSYTENQLNELQYIQLSDIIKITAAPNDISGDYYPTLANTSVWVASTAYSVGDYVKYNKYLYYCKTAHTSGTTFSSTNWIQQSDTFPKELVRKSANSWEFNDVSFKDIPYLDDNTTSTTISASATTGSITLTASTAIFNKHHIGSFWWLGSTVTANGIETQGYVKITGFTSTTQVSASVQSTLSTTAATKDWGEGAFSEFQGFPARVGLFQGRLFYARTPKKPRNIFGSKPYSYEIFTPQVNDENDAGINVELATNATGDGSDIKWLMGGSYLTAGTFGGEFIISGSNSASITPSDASAIQKTNWGGEAIQPECIGAFTHFVQRNGRKLRQFVYDYNTDSHKAVDTTVFSEHITESGIIDVFYQKNPDSILWCLRADGKLAGFTLEFDQQVNAWCLMEMDNAKIVAGEAIPSFSGQYDEVYYIVERIINGQTEKYIERTRDPITPEIQQDCWYVDCGLRYSAYDNTIDNDLTLSAKTGAITITSGDDIFSAEDINKRIRVIDDKANILGQAKITGYTNATQVSAIVVKEFDNTSYKGGYWGISTDDISGLNHLEACEVQILADGAEQTEKIVSAGSITLEKDAWKILVGLKRQSYFTTMPLEAGSQNGTAMGKKKRISEIALRVWRTLGCRVGSDLDNLIDVSHRDPQTDMGVPEKLITGVISNIKFNQGWVWDASITVEQSKPFPLNVLAIALVVTETDK